MTANSHEKPWRPEKSRTTLAEIKELSNQNPTPSRNILKTCSCEGKLSHSHVKTICCLQAYYKGMSTGSALNRKEMIKKKKSWNIRKEKTTQLAKIWINTIGFTSVKFSKLDLLLEAKIKTLMWFYMLVEEIFKRIIL